MKIFAFFFTFAVAVSAYGHGSSYVDRHDNHGLHTEVSHGGYGGGHDDGGYGGGHEAYGGGHDGGYEVESHGGGHEEHGSYGGGHEEHGGHEDHHVDYHSHPSYKYEYGVDDPKTKNHQSHWEHRDGDVVHGQYTLDEADGTKRIVTYSSDKKGGFQAHVERIGHAGHDHGHSGHESHGDYHH